MARLPLRLIVDWQGGFYYARAKVEFERSARMFPFAVRASCTGGGWPDNP